MTDPRRRVVARKILLAYLARNEIPWADVPDIEAMIEDAIGRLSDQPPVPLAKPTPAEVAASIRPDGIVSFIDGQPYKFLKHHLRAHGLHPADYRERYGLPPDYPMVCADYGTRRAAIAREIGLGGSLPNPRQTERRDPDRPPQRETARLVPSVAVPARERHSRPRTRGLGDGGAT